MRKLDRDPYLGFIEDAEEEDENGTNVLLAVDAPQLEHMRQEKLMLQHLNQKYAEQFLRDTSGMRRAQPDIPKITPEFLQVYDYYAQAISVLKMNKDLELFYGSNKEEYVSALKRSVKGLIRDQESNVYASFARLGVRYLDDKKNAWEIAMLVQPDKNAILFEIITILPSGWIHKAATNPTQYTRSRGNAVSLFHYIIQQMMVEFDGLQYGRINAVTPGSEMLVQRAGYKAYRVKTNTGPFHNDMRYAYPTYWYLKEEKEEEEPSISFSWDSADAEVKSSIVFHICHYCGAPPTAVCGQCKAARYCSADCQSQHWRKSHREKCLEKMGK
jgi:hypothetical protein